MKKLSNSFMLFAVVGMLFSSCSNSSKLSFTKRHYRSGYFADSRGKSHTTAAATSVNASLVVKHQASPIAITKQESYTTANTRLFTSKKSIVVEKITAPKKMQENNRISMNSALVSQNRLLLNVGVNNDISGSVGDGHHDRDQVNVPYVVIVLCAIFIPPLGVGLMYGINSYFWIDLILTLLFFFPGMIFALIVVLM